MTLSSLYDFCVRNWKIQSAAELPKALDALNIGLLGAANIAPTAVIKPAKSHPGVAVRAVAARDKQKAIAYAKKHGIPHVLDSYEAMLDDPDIDAVYIPLPSGLHCEWALKAIAKGKHVLVEKPAVVNAIEAERLFCSPLLKQPNAPVLLEAFHFRFQPTWQYFVSLVDRPNIKHVTSIAKLPSYMVPQEGIRFDYKLGGGNMLDLGTYAMYSLRDIIGAEPEECTKCTVEVPPPPYELCDEAAEAAFRFPGNIMGEAIMNLRASITTFPTFKIIVVHNEVNVEDNSLPKEQKKFRVRRLTINNFLMAAMFHSIQIDDEFIIRRNEDGKLMKSWNIRQNKNVFTFQDADINQPSEPHWVSYRHQLEQFVNRIRGKQGSGLWVSCEDSLAQAKMIDIAYEKSGLPLRPTSKFEL